MQRINDLTHDEVVKLTEDELPRFIDLEIAYAGIKMCNPVKMQAEQTVDIKPALTFYSVHDCLYKTQEEAIRVASVAAYRPDYDYNGGGYDYKFPVLKDDTAVREVKLYNKHDVDAIRAVLKKNKEIKETNAKLDKDYQAYNKQIDGCREDVMVVYRDAMEKEYSIKRCIQDYNQYLKIAGGDNSIANEFFEKAYHDENGDIKRIALERVMQAAMCAASQEQPSSGR